MQASATSGPIWASERRLGGLWRFAIAISILNLLGHTVFGFEQAWAHPLVALATAYGMELGIESVDAVARWRRPRYLGSVRRFVEFLLSAHITGLAVSMLIYPGERFWVIAFAAAAAVASKALLRAPLSSASVAPANWRWQHFMNPSNFGISLTLLLFPSVGMAPSYHFTENGGAVLHWGLPLLIVVTGSFLNTKFTGRIPLILAWASCFVLQAELRALWFGTPLLAGLFPMTGVAFILFSFYMVTDPATTPARRSSQIAFGAATAFAYGALMLVHADIGLFFALALVTAGRGACLSIQARSIVARQATVAPTLPIATATGDTGS